MKNTKKLWISLFAVIALSLPSCKKDQNSESKPSTDTEIKETINQNKKLIIKSEPKKTDYYQYEPVSFEGLSVYQSTYSNNQELISEEEITDFTLIYDYNKEEVKEADHIMQVGDLKINVVKEGWVSSSFTLQVNPARALTQSIVITKAADKTSYLAGDKFDPTGLEVTLKTKTSGKYTRNYTAVVEDYTIMIDDTVVTDSYRFEGCGVYNVYLLYTGWDKKELKTYYSVTCIPENTLTTPKQYVDNTITWDEDDTDMTVTIKNTAKEKTEGKGYYSPDEVVNEYNIEDFSKKNFTNWKFTPSTGKVPLLVIPVITPGDEKLATADNWNLINKAFFGKSSNLYFESVHSYYYKSSFGQLDFTGGTTGFFSPSSIDSKYNKFAGYTEDSVFELPQLALNWAEKEYHLDLNDYDSDSDGYVDGIWFVYLHKAAASNNITWAFTSSTNSVNETKEKPIANCFGWASIDFINDAYYAQSSYGPFLNRECDAHVLIHETGHMLGLKDYYSYNSSGTSNDYAPVGNADMMDNNVGDQNPFSKLYLNWITPYVVYGDCTITIPSSQKKNAVIVIPDDNKTLKKNKDGKIVFNTMDEYVVVDYYTDKNMNQYDYDCYKVKHIEGSGARVYHVDNRMAKVTVKEDNDFAFSLYEDPSSPFEEGNEDLIAKVISNSEEGSRSEIRYGLPEECNAFDEIRLISKDGKLISKSNPASNSALFKKNDTFTLNDYLTQFNKKAFNNKNPFSYSVTFTDLA